MPPDEHKKTYVRCHRCKKIWEAHYCHHCGDWLHYGGDFTLSANVEAVHNAGRSLHEVLLKNIVSSDPRFSETIDKHFWELA